MCDFIKKCMNVQTLANDHRRCWNEDRCPECYTPATENGGPLGSTETAGCVVDLAKIAELGQAYSTFELIRTMATQSQIRYGKHLADSDVERMGDIAKDADYIIKRVMDAFDAAK